MKVINGISTFLFLKVVGGVLTDKVRRMIVLASLAGYIRATAELDEATAKELNEVFSLCFTTELALRLPVVLNSQIWKEDTLIREEFVFIATHNLVTGPRVMKFITRVKHALPQWLSYDETQLETDIRSLCNNHKLLA